MKRNYAIDTATLPLNHDLIKQVVFHEAGHAAAIHLYNKQKQLPPVPFQIIINNPRPMFGLGQDPDEQVVAMVEGGCLINGLPQTLIESADYYSQEAEDTYRMAFEADIVNLLVGPLAEAKHIAQRDKQAFEPDKLSPSCLQFFGGQSDLEKVYEYLGNFIADTRLHERTIAELFQQALSFIDSPLYWQAIENLAYHLLDHSQTTISCDEAIAVLDASVAAPA